MELSRARHLLESAVAEGVTPGAQLSVLASGRAHDLCVGRLSYAPDAPCVRPDTAYDLASLTKPLTALAWALSSRELHRPLDAFLPWITGAPCAKAPIDALLSHRAALPSWRPFYLATDPTHAGSHESREAVLHAVASSALEADARPRYSDLGYILAGEALAATHESTFAQALFANALAPLGLSETLRVRGVGAGFVDPRIAPTEDCPWRGRVLQGEVHDDNAFALGGAAGHAGLFGTARALTTLGAHMLDALADRPAPIPPAVARMMLAPRPDGTQRLGWDGKSAEGSSAGTRLGPNTFGHLGFTGISLWCDPDRQLIVALCTNRVHPRRDNPGIRALRPALHDAVFDDLAGQ